MQRLCEYNDFNVEYHKNKSHLRYGQAFCNKFNIQDAELFYEPSTEKAIEIIFVKYIDPT
jgi:hypothetical protein